MIKSGDVIKHKASMDVAIQVFYSTVDPETTNILINGVWINQGQVDTFTIRTKRFPIGVPAEFFIKPEHLKNWLKCRKPDAQLIRNEEWVPLV